MPAPYFLVTNKLRSGTILSEDTIPNFGFANALDGRTSTQVGLEAGAVREIDIDLGSAQTINMLGYANHNASGAFMFVYQSSDNISYSLVGGTITMVAGVQIVELPEFTARYVRLTFTFSAPHRYISDIFLGEALDLPYGMPVGFIPPEMADRDLVESNMTGSGAIVGITVTQRPKKITVKMDDYLATWFESNWANLISGMKQYPAYFQWDDNGQAFYCTLDGKAGQPKYTTSNRMSAQLSLEGFTE